MTVYDHKLPPTSSELRRIANAIKAGVTDKDIRKVFRRDNRLIAKIRRDIEQKCV